jgi:hypothetical protein
MVDESMALTSTGRDWLDEALDTPFESGVVTTSARTFVRLGYRKLRQQIPM